MLVVGDPELSSFTCHLLTTCVTISPHCVLTCQERRLDRLVSKRASSSGSRSFYVLTTWWRGKLDCPKAWQRLMLAPCTLRQGGLLEPDHSEKQTSKKLAGNNPNCLVKPGTVSAGKVLGRNTSPNPRQRKKLVQRWRMLSRERRKRRFRWLPLDFEN